MSEAPLSTFYILIRKTESGDYQLALSDEKDIVKSRMANEGWRAFEVCHEKTLEDFLS